MATQAIGGTAGPSFLQRVLQVNATVTGIIGVVLVAFSAVIASSLGLNQWFIVVVGATCVLAATVVGWLLATGQANHTFARALASAEIAWVLLSYAALAFGWLTPTTLAGGSSHSRPIWFLLSQHLSSTRCEGGDIEPDDGRWTMGSTLLLSSVVCRPSPVVASQPRPSRYSRRSGKRHIHINPVTAYRAAPVVAVDAKRVA